jgi:hypothetical protein|tara:strand:- start:1232 stop:1543 length:312 start_codon:yes stop_codon:yes gene_type:complete
MKSPLVILFIIFNLLAINLVSASNMYDEEMKESPLMQVLGDDDFGICIDKSACSHFCHMSSHMVGFVCQLAQLPIVVAGSIHFASNEPFQTLTLSPPIQPPKA